MVRRLYYALCTVLLGDAVLLAAVVSLAVLA